MIDIRRSSRIHLPGLWLVACIHFFPSFLRSDNAATGSLACLEIVRCEPALGEKRIEVIFPERLPMFDANQNPDFTGFARLLAKSENLELATWPVAWPVTWPVGLALSVPSPL